MKNFKSIQKALEALNKGQMIVVVDDVDRENEGDLVCASSAVTPEHINFMSLYGRGLICVALTQEQAGRLDLPLMKRPQDRADPYGTNFTFSVDAVEGVTTGISAFDRARTIRLASSIDTPPSSLRTPGHVFPLIARTKGVLERKGHTEAAVDLALLAGMGASGVICEIMDQNGEMMRWPSLQKFAKQHSLPLITINELVEYRKYYETRKIAETVLPTQWGEFNLHLYHDAFDREHIVLHQGSLKEAPLIRVHSACITGDALCSLRCDCRAQLIKAFKMISEEKCGAIIYLAQEGRGIGLSQKIKAYGLQDQGLDTVEANIALGEQVDARDYQVAGKILADLGVNECRLLTNNPHKLHEISQHLKSCQRVPLLTEKCAHNDAYMNTKFSKMMHVL